MKKTIRNILSACLALCLTLGLLGCITIIEPPAGDTPSDTAEQETAEESATEQDTRDSETQSGAESETQTETESRGESGIPSERETETTEPETVEPPVAPPIEPTEKIRIYIDQGHNPTGTHNAGAQGNGLFEENVTYAVGASLAALLEADGRFEVRLSRPTADTVLGTTNTESLQVRCREANEWGADYFISIHANSYTNDTANGIEAFAFSEEGEAFLLGTELLDELVKITGFAKRGMKVRTDLHVLKNTQMPAVLVEIGFITNPTEAALMASDPACFSRGLYQGILAYFQD